VIKPSNVSSTSLTVPIPANDVAAAGQITVTVTNPSPGGGTSNALFFAVRLPASQVVITTASPLPADVVGSAYNVSFAATGGTSPYTWSLASSPNTLPNGLTLGNDGSLTGTPTAAGTYSFQVQVTDSATPASTATRAFSLTIVTPLAITTTSLSGATEGQAYSANLQATGGTTPYSWTVSGGALPAGVTLNPNGSLTGTPFVSGNFNFKVQVTDATKPALSDTKSFSLAVGPINGTQYVPGQFVLEPDQAGMASTTPFVALDDNGDTAVIAVTNPNGGTYPVQVFAKDNSGALVFANLLTNVPSPLGGGVAISGDGSTIAVFAQGSLTVFTKPNDSQGWFDPFASVNLVTLKQSNPQQGDNFGFSITVDHSGSTIVVGAPCNFMLRCGTAYVFTEPINGWTNGQTETAQLSATVDLGLGPVPVKSLGFSVSIDASGQNVIAGAPDFIPGSLTPGGVYLFHIPPNGWVTTAAPTAKLLSSDGKNGDLFGWSAAISSDGGTVIVGAPANPATLSPPTGPGGAYVFVQPLGGWAALQPVTTLNEASKLTASQGRNGDGFGDSAVITAGGSRIVVGAPNNPFVGGQVVPGAAYVYLKPSNGWGGGAQQPLNEQQKLTAYSGNLKGFFSNGNAPSTPLSGFAATQGLSISSDATTLAVGGLANANGGVAAPPLEVVYLLIGSPLTLTPTLTSVSPNNLNPGTTPVNLNGTDFTGTPSINFDNSMQACANLSAANVTLVNSGLITADITVPANANAGHCPISVTVQDGTTNTQDLVINLQSVIFGVTGLQLNPATVIGGQQNSTGTVTINGAAPSPNGIDVSLSSNDPSVTVPTKVTIAQGMTSNTFTATTNAVMASTIVTIKASIGLSFQPATLTVNPVPSPIASITSLSPASAPAGSPNLVLTINGTNFVSGATVAFGASNLSNPSITSNQITVNVPAADLVTPGPIFVTVTNPGVAASGPATFMVTSSIAYSAGQIFGSDTFAYGPVVALDDNGDIAAVAGGPHFSGAYVFVKDNAGNWSLVTTLNAVGGSVAISGDGNTVVVGDCSTSCGGNTPTAPDVFAVSNGNWPIGVMNATAILTSSDCTGSCSNFGYSVAVDYNGDTIAVGAPGTLTTCPNAGCPAGTVFVYTMPSGGWTGRVPESAELVDSDASHFDLGASVSIDALGDTVVAGAAHVVDVGHLTEANPGVVDVFRRQGTWPAPANPPAQINPQATLTPPSQNAGDLFGSSVAISGDGHTIVAGAEYYPCPSSTCAKFGGTAGPGAAFVFVNNSDPSAWTTTNQPAATLNASNKQNNDSFGMAASISYAGDTILVGTPGALQFVSQPFSPVAGQAYLFNRAGAWNGLQQESQILTAHSGASIGGQSVTPGNGFGAGVSISGHRGTIGVGGFATVLSTLGQGVVYTFAPSSPSPLITTASLQSGTLGFAYSQAIQAIGGTIPYSWSVSSATLPAGITLNPSTGLLSGTPTAAGNSNFTVQVADASNPVQTASQTLTLVVSDTNPVPFITSLTPSMASAGLGQSLQLTISGKNFASSSTVNFGTDMGLPTIVNPQGTQIDLTIPANDLASARTVTVTVTNPPPGGGTSNPINFQIAALRQTATAIGAGLSANLGSKLVVNVRVNEPIIDANTTTPLGTISFTDVSNPSNSDTFGSCSLAQSLPGIANCSTTVTLTAPAGVHTINATYMPTDGVHAGSTTTSPAHVTVIQILAVSVDNNGKPASLGASEPLSLSLSGRYVSFLANFGSGSQLYVRETCTGANSPCTAQTVLSSVSDTGQSVAPDTTSTNLSGDGSLFAFNALCAPGTCVNPVSDIVFVRQICWTVGPACPASSTTAESVDPHNSSVPASAFVLSRDGRYLVFRTVSSGTATLYLRDTCLGAPSGSGCSASDTVVDINSKGVQTQTQDATPIAVSAGGRYVLFGGNSNSRNVQEFYIWDSQTDTSVLVNRDAADNAINSGVTDFSMSDDGRFVTFDAPGLTMQQVYARDTCIGITVSCTPKTVLVSQNTTSGETAGGASTLQGSSLDVAGRYVAFSSSSNDLVTPPPGGANTYVYVRDTCLQFGTNPGAIPGCSPATKLVSKDLAGNPLALQSAWILGGDGHYLAFTFFDTIDPGTSAEEVALVPTSF